MGWKLLMQFNLYFICSEIEVKLKPKLNSYLEDVYTQVNIYSLFQWLIRLRDQTLYRATRFIANPDLNSFHFQAFLCPPRFLTTCAFLFLKLCHPAPSPPFTEPRQQLFHLQVPLSI